MDNRIFQQKPSKDIKDSDVDDLQKQFLTHLEDVKPYLENGPLEKVLSYYDAALALYEANRKMIFTEVIETYYDRARIHHEIADKEYINTYHNSEREECKKHYQFAIKDYENYIQIRYKFKNDKSYKPYFHCGECNYYLGRIARFNAKDKEANQYLSYALYQCRLALSQIKEDASLNQKESNDQLIKIYSLMAESYYLYSEFNDETVEYCLKAIIHSLKFPDSSTHLRTDSYLLTVLVGALFKIVSRYDVFIKEFFCKRIQKHSPEEQNLILTFFETVYDHPFPAGVQLKNFFDFQKNTYQALKAMLKNNRIVKHKQELKPLLLTILNSNNEQVNDEITYLASGDYLERLYMLMKKKDAKQFLYIEIEKFTGNKIELRKRETILSFLVESASHVNKLNRLRIFFENHTDTHRTLLKKLTATRRELAELELLAKNEKLEEKKNILVNSEFYNAKNSTLFFENKFSNTDILKLKKVRVENEVSDVNGLVVQNDQFDKLFDQLFKL